MKKYCISLAFALLFLSCTKQEGQPEEDFDQHPTWTQEDSTAFWDKQQGDITIKPYILYETIP